MSNAAGAHFAQDAYLTGKSQGYTTASATSTQLATGRSGVGTLLIWNTDASTGVYVTFDGTAAAASTSSFYIPGGAPPISITLADVSQVKCYSSGSPVVSWAHFMVQ